MEHGFGSELRRTRKEQGIGLNEFARKIAWSRSHLSMVERGLTPASSEFAEICDQVLDADGRLAALARTEVAESEGRPDGENLLTLPPRPHHCYGRPKELDHITQFLTGVSTDQLCVISGFPGTGKTTMALCAAWHVAADFPDGCFFFDLGEQSPGGTRDILDALLRHLRVTESKIPSRLDAMAGLWRSRLAGKRILLVLDDVRRAADVLPLLSSEPGCKIVVTSRKRLSALDEAVHVPVGILDGPGAEAVFRAVGGEGAALAPDSAVRAVVDSCGRLPLAVRIAAARLRRGPMATVGELAERLSYATHRLELLDDGDRSVAAALTVTCEELTAEQRRVLALLALYPGTTPDLYSIAALADVDRFRASLLVDGLADVHLVDYESSFRVSMHSLVREFSALVLLPQIPLEERRDAVRRVLEHGLHFAVAADKLLTPQRYRPPVILDDFGRAAVPFDDRVTALAWFEREWPSLVALCHCAADSGLSSLCWQLAFAMRDFFFLTKRWGPWVESHRRAIECARAAGARAWLAMSLSNLGVAHSDRGDLTVAVDCFKQSLSVYQELGDDHGIVNAISNLAWTELYLGNHEASMDGLRTALRYYRLMRNKRNAAITLRGIALLEAELGMGPAAVRHAQEARAEFQALGLELDAVMSVNCAAWAHFREGDHPAARACYDEALALAGRCASRYEQARALTGLGNIHRAAGEDEKAAELWSHADALYGGLEPIMLGEARVRLAS
ncbi:tetratricopeptide repeat protein [Streptomyces sp. NPDC021224]|uniref:tetratricopeptide repeat protein n=1 Tax=unclassified Streptomyces TaxID=2593676 RepID=UPI003787F689